MSRIFISYKREDRPRVKQLAENLIAAGHEVWYDQSLAIGDHWWDVILEQIRACDVFVFAISQIALRSEPCKRERRYAEALKKPSFLIRVGPISALPTEYALIQFGDYSKGDTNQLIRLLGGINRSPANQPLPDPLPTPPDPPIAPIDELRGILETGEKLNFPDQTALMFRLEALHHDPPRSTAADRPAAPPNHLQRDRRSLRLAASHPTRAAPAWTARGGCGDFAGRVGYRRAFARQSRRRRSDYAHQYANDPRTDRRDRQPADRYAVTHITRHHKADDGRFTYVNPDADDHVHAHRRCD